MKLFHLLIFLTFYASIPIFGVDRGALTLPRAVNLMLEYEPELNAAEYDTLSAIGDHRLARAELRPQVAVESSVGYSNRNRTTDGLTTTGQDLLSRDIGISIRQLLYDGGVARNNLNSARNAHIAQQISEKSLIEARVVDLSEVFLEVLRVRKQIELAERNIENHRAMRDMLQERVNAGGSRADVGLVQGRLQLAINTLSTQRLALELAYARFERLCGAKPNNLVFPKIPTIPSSIEKIDISQNYDYLAAQEALESAEHRYEAAKARKRPRVYFDAGLSHGVNTQGTRGDDDEASALIVGSWDIFTGGRNKAYECREHYQVGKFEELLRAADRQRKYNLKLLWREREGSENSMAALERYAEELAQVSSDYEEQFRIGRQELLNILDIQQEYYSANSRFLDAKFDRDQSSFRIMGVQGILTEHLIGSGDLNNYCKAPINDSNCHPNNRVPVTQNCLMTGKFDGNGPIVDITPSTHQAYYVDRSQLPVKCDDEEKCEPCAVAKKIGFTRTNEDTTRRGPFRKLFARKNK
ncbi:MAG: TolC family protein [Verrucomicrobiales bacterium]|nr:TolC family protein [Verrucomicrobiales bacterium]